MLNLTDLENLCLENNEISSIGRIYLLRNLETLCLSDNKISDVSYIDPLTKLDYVTLSNQRIELEAKKIWNNSLTINTTVELEDSNNITNISENGLLNEDKNQITFHNAKTCFNVKVYQPVIVNDEAIDKNSQSIMIPSNFQDTTTEDSVYIPDNNLKLGILKTLGITTMPKKYANDKVPEGTALTTENCQQVGVTPYQMSSITYLSLPSSNINYLLGLQYCYNITAIDLSNNNIHDIFLLSNMRNITCINLSNNKITDFDSFDNLSKLMISINSIT